MAMEVSETLGGRKRKGKMRIFFCKVVQNFKIISNLNQVKN